MLLAIDVGNTQTVIGVYGEGDRVVPREMWRVSTSKADTADDVRVKLLPLLQAADLGVEGFTAAALASVVPALTCSWKKAVHDLLGVEPQVCTAEVATAAGLFETDYPRPREIGADRVADAVAARALFGAPVIVVDFGTATNIEVLDAEGRFIGGVIAPGVETSASALFSQATRLSAIDLVAPPAVIGTSTEEAIQAGIVFGEADRVDGLLSRIYDELGGPCATVATGGLATLISAHSRHITSVMPELTLEGLRLIAEKSASE